jgi:hypothetical protein
MMSLDMSKYPDKELLELTGIDKLSLRPTQRHGQWLLMSYWS